MKLRSLGYSAEVIFNDCPHCRIKIAGQQKFQSGVTHQLARHIKRCSQSTPEDRLYYKEKGYWPPKKK